MAEKTQGTCPDRLTLFVTSPGLLSKGTDGQEWEEKAVGSGIVDPLCESLCIISVIGLLLKDIKRMKELRLQMQLSALLKALQAKRAFRKGSDKACLALPCPWLCESGLQMLPELRQARGHYHCPGGTCGLTTLLVKNLSLTTPPDRSLSQFCAVLSGPIVGHQR